MTFCFCPEVAGFHLVTLLWLFLAACQKEAVNYLKSSHWRVSLSSLWLLSLTYPLAILMVSGRRNQSVSQWTFLEKEMAKFIFTCSGQVASGKKRHSLIGRSGWAWVDVRKHRLVKHYNRELPVKLISAVVLLAPQMALPGHHSLTVWPSENFLTSLCLSRVSNM